MIDQTFAHFRITARLGEGGMGTVYRAEDTKLGREVGLKFLPEAFAADAERKARFTREAQVLASLNHPNIAGIHSVEEVPQAGSDVPRFGMAAVAAASSEYIPQDDANKSLVIANTKLLGPGEEDTITFTLEAGTYPFLCSFPGHFALMQGTITAK